MYCCKPIIHSIYVVRIVFISLPFIMATASNKFFIFWNRRDSIIHNFLVSSVIYPQVHFIMNIFHGTSLKHLLHLVYSYFLARDVCLEIYILKYFGHVLLFSSGLKSGGACVCAHVVNKGNVCPRIEVNKFPGATLLPLGHTLAAVTDLKVFIPFHIHPANSVWLVVYR